MDGGRERNHQKNQHFGIADGDAGEDGEHVSERQTKGAQQGVA